MKSQVRDDLFAEFPIPLLKSKLADKIKQAGQCKASFIAV